jgi:hypothetical protein
MENHVVWSARSVTWLVCIAVASAWLAGCITLLNVTGRVVMSLGGYVALGGPYEIAHPAPEWMTMVPLFILSGFAVGGWSVYLSQKSGGFSLLGPVWGGLFISLGYQFAVMGLNPPWGEGLAWGWLVCAILFVPMGVLGSLFMLGTATGRQAALGTRWPYARVTPSDDATYRRAYTLCVVAGAALGILGALKAFAHLAG